jgi:hypothetical protein
VRWQLIAPRVLKLHQLALLPVFEQVKLVALAKTLQIVNVLTILLKPKVACLLMNVSSCYNSFSNSEDINLAIKYYAFRGLYINTSNDSKTLLLSTT